MLNTFVRPNPNPTLIRMLAPANRILCLKGLPGLRDVPVLNRVPGIRGICSIRHIDFPEEDRQRLAASCHDKSICFITPNHPEFFTDWMLDKEIIYQCAPKAASWATNGVVNGLGKMVQKFWLANNLIAQIPGNSDPSRDYSVEWAGKGNGVLLHSEGAVGWHSNEIAPLFSGAIDMSREGLATDGAPDEAYVAPVVWKLVFNNDARRGLHRECSYIERKLGIPGGKGLHIAKRVFAIYSALLERDIEAIGGGVDGDAPFDIRRQGLLAKLADAIATTTGHVDTEADLERENGMYERDLSRHARKWLRENKDNASAKEVRQRLQSLDRFSAIGDYAFSDPFVSQEELADHLKRIRRDFCFGALRDTLNSFFPQAATQRTAIIRVPEPLALHLDTSHALDVDDLRKSMQSALDAINKDLREDGRLATYPNPFHN